MCANSHPRIFAVSSIVLFSAVAACSDTGQNGAQGDASAVAEAAVNPDQWPAVQSAVRKDPAIEARIAELLGRMSLEAKIGQVIQADLGSVTPEEVRDYRLGSVLNGGNSAPGGKQYAPPEEWLAAADAFYLAALEVPEGEPVIPLIWGTDAVHGHNNVTGAVIFPHNIGLGAANNPELIRRIAEVTALEIATTGLDWTFAPTLAVVRDDRWGRSYEGYSEDPEIVVNYAGAFVEGLQGIAGASDFLGPERVVATAKHYLGDGGTVDGRDQGDNQDDEAGLRDIHGAGYPPALAAGAQTVMASFSSWQGKKMHGNKGLLTDVLKERMGFDGFVVGDWNAHGQVEGCANTSCAKSFNAGIDMFMAPDSWKGLYAATLEQVRAGEISMERLDDAVTRILRVKLRAGLFEKPKPSDRPLSGRFELLAAPEHRAVARQAVRESLVLLKNAGGLLPLDPGTTVLVAGDGADNIAKQSGGWTLSWQATGHTNDEFPNGQSIYGGIAETVAGAGGRAVLSIDGSYEDRPDVAIVVFGEDPYAEFQGDIDNLAYSPTDRRDLALLQSLKSDGIPVVAVFLSGRPLWVNPEINASDAFVAAWLPGSEGGGVADVLFRAADGAVTHDFKGRLSFSWPRTATQPPQNRGDADYDPLFAYGFGLTYADDGGLDALPEDSGLAGQLAESRDVYFSNGRAVLPWKLLIDEAGAPRQEIEAAAGTSTGNTVQYRTNDRRQQEDSRAVAWGGAAPASVLIAGGTPLDLSRETNGAMALAVDLRVDEAPSADVRLGIGCGESCAGSIEISSLLSAESAKQWGTLLVPLSCFRNAGADMANVVSPFALETTGSFALSFSDIRLASHDETAIACPAE